MSLLIVLYFVIGPLIVVASVIGSIIYRRNRLKNNGDRPPYGFQMTDEILIDPTTGIKQRVWFNPDTGQRYYQNIN